MVGYFFLGILLLAALLLLVRAMVGADPAMLARLVKVLAIAMLGTGLVLFLVAGRVGIAGIMLTVAGPLVLLWLRRGGPRMGTRPGSRPSGAGRSDLETAFLSMSLDHATGLLDGRVKRGRFAGRRLAQLSPDQLRALLAEASTADRESVAVIEAYLDRTQGPDWRAASSSAGAQDRSGGASSGGRMTREEAYSVLGLQAGAGPDEVRDAHRRLMKKLHPDQGGSDYLAARVNQARDVLLGS